MRSAAFWESASKAGEGVIEKEVEAFLPRCANRA